MLHGPQSGRLLQERQEWWEETRTIVSGMCQHFPNYVMLDANAKTGPRCQPIVFEHDDSVSSNTIFFLEFLTDLELCLPCTSAVHSGTQSTWISPDGLTDHRIDYVAIPQSFLARCSWSSLVPTLDTGNEHHDHTATALQLEWYEDISGHNNSHAKSLHDRQKIRQNRNSIDLCSVEVPSWSCDIESQVRALNESVHQHLQNACPLDRKKPKKSFIDDATWALRAEKLELKKRLTTAHKQIKFDLQCKFFKIWASKLSIEDNLHAQQHPQLVDCQILRLTCQYRCCSRQLKHALQTLKSAKLQHAIVDAGSHASAGKLLHVMKPFIGSTNPKEVQESLFTNCQKRRWKPLHGPGRGSGQMDPVLPTDGGWPKNVTCRIPTALAPRP